MRHPRTVLVLCALAVAFAGARLYSQAVNATLVGNVSDASGAVVPGAKVTLTEVQTGSIRTNQTNEGGNYVFPDLPPGKYSLTVEQAGFKKQARNDIDILVDTTPRVDFQLQPGDVSETVEVKATPALLQTDSVDTGAKMDTAQVADMPLGVNRNFQSLLNLVPGTTPATFDHSQFFNAASSLQTEVNGQMRMGNNYLIEGTDDNERTGLLQILIPPAESIASVDVATSDFDPEMGRGTGAVTNVILKSGTNQFHGSAYEFLQNSAFNARSFFNPSVGHLAYNYVGGSIGGPMIKNKLFFFGDYLAVLDHEANTNLVTIPSAAFRTGDLSAAPTKIYNPFTGNPDGTGRALFPNNQIPTYMINPVSVNIMALLPATNEPFNAAKPSNNYYAVLPFQKTNNAMDYKMDWVITDNDRLSGRFSYAEPSVFQAPIFGNAGGGPAQGAFQGTGIQTTYSGGLNYDHVFSPSLLTEARLGIAHYHNNAQPSDYGQNDAQAIGIPGVNISQFTSGQVGISIGGGYSSPIIGYSPSIPWVRAEANVDLVNTWTKTLGNHTIKFGADLKRIRDDLLQTQTFSPRGLITFGENQTSIPGGKTGFGNDFASFLLDVPSQVGRDLGTYFPAYRQWQFFPYVGDRWQMTPKLTLDLGLRWEYYPPATPQFNGGFSNYNVPTNSLIIAGVGSNPNNLGMKYRYTNFAPRVGGAYRATSSTVLRAGFGISYTPFPDNNYAYNYPIRANNSYQPAGDGYGPALLTNGQPATFQAGFPLPQPIVIPPNGIISPAPISQAYYAVNLNFRNPYVEAWNFSVQQALAHNFTLDVAYVGNHGVDTVSQPNINAGMIIGAGTKGQPEYPRTASTTQIFQGFSSNYNALQVKFDRRFSNSFGMTTAFTWAKALNYQIDDDGALDFYIYPQRNYARADFDREFSFVQSYIYELPVGPGKRWLTSGVAARILGGWQLNGILTVLSGTPMTITANGGTLNAPSNTQTADQVGSVQILKGINTNPWFSTSSFAQPVGLRFGTTGRNIISGPGFFSLNGSLFKNVAITERFNLQLRLETFNLTNTPEFANPTTSITSATFGEVTSTLASGTGANGVGGGRVVQLGVKFTF